MAYTIKPEGDEFVLYDDGYVFSRYTTEAEAIKERDELIADEKLSDAVSDAVDVMLDSLADKFPNVRREKLREMISDKCRIAFGPPVPYCEGL